MLGKGKREARARGRGWGRASGRRGLSLAGGCSHEEALSCRWQGRRGPEPPNAFSELVYTENDYGTIYFGDLGKIHTAASRGQVRKLEKMTVGKKPVNLNKRDMKKRYQALPEPGLQEEEAAVGGSPLQSGGWGSWGQGEQVEEWRAAGQLSWAPRS